jgi:hypothetical protein
MVNAKHSGCLNSEVHRFSKNGDRFKAGLLTGGLPLAERNPVNALQAN